MSTSIRSTPTGRSSRSLALLAALAATGLSAVPALAASVAYSFTGTIDFGDLAGQAFSGSFSFDDASVSTGFDGGVALSSFSMSFAGQTYTLASADVAPQAVFVAGSFTGIDYADTASLAAPRPQVTLTAGFTDVAEAQLAYTVPGGNLPGFGSLGFTVTAVPEPATYGLMAAGLLLVGAAARRQRRG